MGVWFPMLFVLRKTVKYSFSQAKERKQPFFFDSSICFKRSRQWYFPVPHYIHKSIQGYQSFRPKCTKLEPHEEVCLSFDDRVKITDLKGFEGSLNFTVRSYVKASNGDCQIDEKGRRQKISFKVNEWRNEKCKKNAIKLSMQFPEVNDRPEIRVPFPKENAQSGNNDERKNILLPCGAPNTRIIPGILVKHLASKCQSVKVIFDSKVLKLFHVNQFRWTSMSRF